jgi:ElaB/YqjD/DUF883 family membrane-anchored ribosome-binding protein
MRAPRKFVMSLPEPGDMKAKVRAQHDQLKEQALANERMIILTRMQLRLIHDHRDLDALRKRVENLLHDAEADSNEEAENQRLRMQCRRLKGRIEYEKDRIRKESWVCADEYYAAVAIQSAWRAFAFRKTHAANR